MKISTARLGEVEIDAAQILTFPDGIIGFPDFKRYIELDVLESGPISLLQAVDAPDLGFFIVDPKLFVQGYIVDISHEDMDSLNAEKLTDMEVKTIVTIPENPYEMTTNLQGPIVISIESRLAKQIVNSHQNYSTKHRILANPETSPVGPQS